MLIGALPPSKTEMEKKQTGNHRHCMICILLLKIKKLLSTKKQTRILAPTDLSLLH